MLPEGQKVRVKIPESWRFKVKTMLGASPMLGWVSLEIPRVSDRRSWRL